jgi:hypothetical protein
MTIHDVEELTRYWIDHPPLHLLIAAYLDIGATWRGGVSGRKANIPPTRESKAHIGQILAELGSGFATGDVQAGLDPVVLDFTELQRRHKATA